MRLLLSRGRKSSSPLCAHVPTVRTHCNAYNSQPSRTCYHFVPSNNILPIARVWCGSLGWHIVAFACRRMRTSDMRAANNRQSELFRSQGVTSDAFYHTPRRRKDSPFLLAFATPSSLVKPLSGARRIATDATFLTIEDQNLRTGLLARFLIFRRTSRRTKTFKRFIV